MTVGHTIHPSSEELLHLSGIEPTTFKNSALKVAGIQMQAAYKITYDM